MHSIVRLRGASAARTLQRNMLTLRLFFFFNSLYPGKTLAEGWIARVKPASDRGRGTKSTSSAPAPCAPPPGSDPSLGFQLFPPAFRQHERAEAVVRHRAAAGLPPSPAAAEGFVDTAGDGRFLPYSFQSHTQSHKLLIQNVTSS